MNFRCYTTLLHKAYHQMNGYNRLVRRNTTYYIRARIPNEIRDLVHKNEFIYSLKTHNYYEALEKVRKESYKVDCRINFLRALKMRIQNNELVLDDKDIDKLVLHHLKLVESTFENRYDDIASGSYDTTDLLINSPQHLETAKQQCSEQTQNPELKCVELYIKEYFEEIKNNRKTNYQTAKMISRLDEENIAIIKDYDQPADWVKNAKTALKGLDKYVKDKTADAINDEGWNHSMNPRIKRCLKQLDEEKQKTAQEGHKTSWRAVFKEFSQVKKNDNIDDSSIRENEVCLDTIFTILEKNYIEHITYDDCYNISTWIHNLPRRWQAHCKKKNLPQLVKEGNDKVKISKTTIKKYLQTFKEFLTFCRKRRIITENFRDDFIIPKRHDTISIEEFSKDELKAIFNPATYPNRHNIYHSARYWIPLIALYTGMRLNEICQLYCDDVKYENKIWYFQLTDERPDQHLKNKQSHRIVPIHPKLIEFGLIDYLKDTRKNKKERLFFKLEYSKKNHYAHQISTWFGRYLKEVQIKTRSKVFHSIRHLVKTYLRDCKVPLEYQNAICGWTGTDVGQKVYAGKVPLKNLYEEICKLDYPFLNENLEKIKEMNQTD